MATATQTKTDDIYTIEMVGTYYSRDGATGLITKEYHATWQCPAKLVAECHPHTIFKRSVAPKLLPRLYTDFLTLATFEVAKATCTNPGLLKEDINMQNKHQLVQFIADRSMEIDPSLFDDDMQLRQAIIDYRKDPDAFKRNQKKMYVHKSADLQIRRALEETIDFDDLLALNGIGKASGKTPTKKSFRVEAPTKEDRLGDL